MDSQGRRRPAPWLIALSAIGCLAGLLAWPETPQRRFLAVLLGALLPLAVYGCARLLHYLSVRLATIVRQHNWRQFSLRGLLAFTIVCAIGSLIWSWTRPDIRYRRMRERQQLAAAVERLGGNLTHNGMMIDLTGQILNNEDLESLAALPGAREVMGVTLNGTGVTDEIVVYLNRFPKLNYIGMDGCLAITDGALKQMEGNRKLRMISTKGTQAGEAGVESLLRANQLLLVHWGYHNSSSLSLKDAFDEEAETIPPDSASGY